MRIKNLGGYAKKGKENLNYGKKQSKEACEKRSKTLMGHEVTQVTRNKLSKFRKGKNYEELLGKEKAEELRKKLGILRKGELNSNYGKIATKEKREKMSIGIKKAYKTGKLKPNGFKKGNIPWNKGLPPEKQTGWLGGISFEPYGLDFNKKLKRLIKERDGCCMLCNLGFEDLKLLKRRIHIHHVNYDKRCNLQQNLITLCINCHGLTQKNRGVWVKLFQSLLAEKYNYQYSEKEEIVLDLNNFTKQEK